MTWARSASGTAGLLLCGGLLVCVGARIGVVHTFDGSARGAASGAVWVVLLPAVVALLLSGFTGVVGPVASPGVDPGVPRGVSSLVSLAVTAGAGLMGWPRVLSDLTLLKSPNTAIRPEMFYEVSNLAQPFTIAGGVWAVLGGDLLTALGGIVAARQLTAMVSLRSEQFVDDAAAHSSGGQGPAGPSSAKRNDALLAVGLTGAVALLVAYLGLPYSGGYLAARYLPAEVDLWGIGAALTVAVLAGGAVLTAAVISRPVAFALLSGVALGAAVPFLTAVAVRIAGAPVQLNPTVGIGLAGAAVLASAGLPLRARRAGAPAVEPADGAVRTLTLLAGALSLLVAVAAAAAWRLPQLRYNGGADPALPDGFAVSAPLALPFLTAAVAPLVGAVLALVPWLARAGRAVVSLAWIPLVYAVAQSLNELGQVVTSASVPNAGFAAPRWSAGPGLWCGAVGAVIGLAALVVSVAAAGAARNSSSLVTDEDTLVPARRVGQLVAAGLTVVTLTATALPVYRSAVGRSATLPIGFGVDSWGVFVLAAGAIAAAWAAGLAVRRSEAVAFALTGAGTIAVRLVVPPAVRAQNGFEHGAGLYAGYVAVLAFVIAAATLALSVRRIRMIDLAAPAWRGSSSTRSGSASRGKSGSASRGKKGRR